METFKRLTLKINNKIMTAGWVCEAKKVFVKMVDKNIHLYRNKDSWNINWNIFKELDEINGICIYDYTEYILYYINADDFL
jgi:hypothetical protein